MRKDKKASLTLAAGLAFRRKLPPPAPYFLLRPGSWVKYTYY